MADPQIPLAIDYVDHLFAIEQLFFSQAGAEDFSEKRDFQKHGGRKLLPGKCSLQAEPTSNTMKLAAMNATEFTVGWS